ncbi:MAG: malonyl-ACP O-methyltransferase BioC [Aquisalimonadaceae bacterium]
MSDELPPEDRFSVRRAFDGAADTYDSSTALQREVGERLLERLDLVRLTPERVLDVGAGTGLQSAALRERYPKARVIALDTAAHMLHAARRRGSWLRPLPCIQADAAALPVADHSIDLLFSSMAIQWCKDPLALFREFQRVLRPGGLLLFSTVGPDTLRELRASWAAVDDRPHVNTFIDMHDLGDALVQARFADPVMDMEMFTLTYPTLPALVSDLRGAGVGTVLGRRGAGLMGRAAYRRLLQAYSGFKNADGLLPASYEIVYGHAWAADVLPQAKDAGGAVLVSLDNMRRKLRSSR